MACNESIHKRNRIVGLSNRSMPIFVPFVEFSCGDWWLKRLGSVGGVKALR